MSLGNIQTWVQILNSIVTTAAIIAAAWWFFRRRASAKSLQITITLNRVIMVKDIRVAIIQVQLKNTGQTRIKKAECRYIAEEVKAWIGPGAITPIEVILDDTRRVDIFKTQIELEPNDVLLEDVALALNKKITCFAVRVEFRVPPRTTAFRGRFFAWIRLPRRWKSIVERITSSGFPGGFLGSRSKKPTPERGTIEGWAAIAIFNADEITKASSTIDLPTDQKARLG